MYILKLFLILLGAKKRRLESDQDGQRSNENTDGQTQILKSPTSMYSTCLL